MTMNPILPAIVIGGVAYEYVLKPKGQPTPPTSAPGYTVASYPSAPLRNSVGVNLNGFLNQSPVGPQGNGYLIASVPSDIQATWYPTIDPALKAKLDAVQAAAQKAYNDANEVAKAAAADKLNKDLKLDPPLTGHEDWKTISSVVGGAAGAAVGAAIGGPLGAKIGALCGAYLGVKIEELLEKDLGKIKEWIKGKWGDIEDFASDVYDDVAGIVPW